MVLVKFGEPINVGCGYTNNITANDEQLSNEKLYANIVPSINSDVYEGVEIKTYELKEFMKSVLYR